MEEVEVAELGNSLQVAKGRVIFIITQDLVAGAEAVAMLEAMGEMREKQEVKTGIFTATLLKEEAPTSIQM